MRSIGKKLKLRKLLKNILMINLQGKYYTFLKINIIKNKCYIKNNSFYINSNANSSVSSLSNNSFIPCFSMYPEYQLPYIFNTSTSSNLIDNNFINYNNQAIPQPNLSFINCDNNNNDQPMTIPVYQPSNFYTPSHVNNSTPWISSDISHSKT